MAYPGFEPGPPRSEVRRGWINLAHAFSLPLRSYKAEILASVVFNANWMHLNLRILKFDILRVPPIRISTKRLTHSSKI
jgi:hypothetical protein